jgi:C4-dicarboxylate-specific signal transduction histidine kinase
LGQVVLNLMQNGLDAMGSVERARRKLEIAAKCEGEVMYLTVRDHGTGIPLEVQQRMYDAFFTTKGVGKGTGLGLYICKEIIEGFGGHMELTTGPTGTTFHLMIPLAEE